MPSNCAKTLNRHFRARALEDRAQRQSISALLNCYLREVAAPSGEFEIDTEENLRDCPMGLRYVLSSRGGKWLLLHLPQVQARIILLVGSASASLNFEYISAPYYKQREQGWALLSYRMLATLLIKQLAERYEQPINMELLLQIENSVDVMSRIVKSAPHYSHWGQGSTGFLRSEQSLSYGHSFHPAPKCREGFDETALNAYSPEMGAAFQLAYFAVSTEDVLQCAIDENPSRQTTDLLAPLLPTDVAVPSGFHLVPVHPWQAQYLLSQAVVKAALASGRIKWMGAAGGLFYPTASVRTLYQPGNPYFYKGSLHIRVTNCIRKNAFYELESAVALTRLLRIHLADLQTEFPHFRVLYEPAYLSVQFSELAPCDNRVLIEGFGMLFREAFGPTDFSEVTPVLAGALFSEDLQGHFPVRRALGRLATRCNVSYYAAAVMWFEEYLQNCLHPLLYCFFRLGVVFEPHLQNCVIGLKGDLPVRVYIRDLEGTKLVSEHWSESQLHSMSVSARASVLYDAEKGWARVAYCLFANNLFQALAALAASNSELEQALWQTLRAHLVRFQHRHGCVASQVIIDALLNGQPIPYKTNLLTRVFKRADKQSTYVPLQHGLGGNVI